MEKIVWIRSVDGMIRKDGLSEINSYLEQGWKVKMISACAMGDSSIAGQAYVVIEKEDHQ